MKKIYCFALIILSLFSCVFFSACGDKYKDLKIDIYSSNGEIVEELNFVIDSNGQSSSQRIGIEFLGIDKKEVGQVKVYSLPNELIVDSNYTYNGNMCYVDISPIMPSSVDAKLVVSHLSSGKTKQIDLNIEQKSNNVEMINSKYIISIPQEEAIHSVDFSKLVNLVPVGSTDKIYFKIKNSLPAGVEAISVDEENIEGVFSGFRVGSSVEDSTEATCVQIYPVTYMEGYAEDNRDKYSNKIISIYFKHTLNAENLEIVSSDEIDVDFNNLKLISNDANLNSFKLTLTTNNTPLINTNYFDMYEIEAVSAENQMISTFIDKNNDVVVMANAYTSELVEVKLVLKPINYVGEIKRVEKSIFVKGEVKADNIRVEKNGEEILTDEKTNIFDYYEEGNSLGALFTFTPTSSSGIEVNELLNGMKIVVAPEILCEENCFNVPDSVNVNSKLYSLMFHLYNDYLEFEYDENSGKMVSETISADDRIYIKYVDGKGTVESSEFKMSVKTVFNEKEVPENWKSLKAFERPVDFNRLEGIKSVTLEAGIYKVENGVGTHTPAGEGSQKNNPQYVYLNRLEGVDNDNADIKYVSIQNSSVLSVDDSPIQKTELIVEVQPLSEVGNGLKICFGDAKKDSDSMLDGSTRIIYQYSASLDSDVVGLIFRANTDIGDYKITFYQENIAKASVICRIYEDITSILSENISFETNKTAFKNVDYTADYSSDYIVASGQNLNLSVELSDDVLKSQIVKGYSFDFFVGAIDGNTTITVENKMDYFEIAHDDSTFNNAQLRFLRGTNINGNVRYVYLTIKVITKKYDNLVTESTEVNEIPFNLSFFIYEEIKDEQISLNHTNITRYFNKYLGVYNTEHSKANLEVCLADNLWNYVTKTTNSFGELHLVEWKLNKEDGVTLIDNSDDIKLGLQFDYTNEESDGYVRIMKAYVRQFEKIFELQCVINVEKPIISERVIMHSEIEIGERNNETYYYINLKKGETYEVEAKNYSSKGNVTFAETLIQVFDQSGSAYTAKDYFEIDQTNNTITVKEVSSNFKLVVFAKDGLKYIPSSDNSGYNNPSSFMMNFSGEEDGLYNKAYFVLDIIVSDGTEENPYLIKTANDFWEIDDSSEARTSYYKLMNSISLDNTTDTNSKIITDFAGIISTDGNNLYTIDGIKLNNENKNLFNQLENTAKISNIKFVVECSYNLSTSTVSEEYLGLVGHNFGTLSDVSVMLSGSANFASGIQYYFGGLVGENCGTLEYFNSYGATGTIALSGKSETYFGGLAGKNVGKILGSEEKQASDTQDEVVLNVSSGREKALSQVSITSTMTHSSSSIGGVVGLNTYSTDTIGIVQNAFVQVSINTETTSNVGGVIGTNKQIKNSLTFKSKNDNISEVTDVLTDVTEDGVTKFIDLAIYNVKSSSTIKAKDNVGGIVGSDEFGVYIECDYQVLLSSTKTPVLQAKSNLGGIAGKSDSGKFAYCSVMSYCWNYAGLQADDKSNVITDVADIAGNDYVGGIVGFAKSSTEPVTIEPTGTKIDNRVLVVYSHVNAYLSSTNNIGGILSAGTANSKQYISVIFNAYFIGKLDGNVVYQTPTTVSGSVVSTHHLCLDNNGSSVYNAVYSLNLEEINKETVVKLGHIKDGAEFKIDGNPSLNFWWHNQNINGGYIFITTDKTPSTNSLPIFDLSPESIEVNVKEEHQKAKGLEKVLVLEYFDFSSNTTLSDVLLSTLNEKFNRDKKVLDLLDFTINPTGLGSVVLNVKSTNTNIVDVTFDGRLLINGVGECELIFSSVLNPNAGEVEDRTIKVVVDYPIGDTFNLSTSKTDLSKLVKSSEAIAKNTSRQYYVVTSGYIERDFNEDSVFEVYSYRTKENVNLQVEITADAGITIEEYIKISGQTGEQVDNKLTVNLNNKTPFTISVIKMLETGTFNVKVIPYIEINGIKMEYVKTAEFTLSTKAGATDVSFSYDEAVVYPNDTVYLTAHISTDIEIDAENLLATINVKDYVNNLKFNVTNNNNIPFEMFVDSSNYNSENEIQTIVFRIEFGEFDLEDVETSLKFELETTIGNSVSVNYTIIPQRINKIEIKNYYYKNVGTDTTPKYELVQDDVLKPNFAGLMIVDIVPNNGYYDYLEISDITGKEEILFIQVDEEGNALTLNSDPSSDNKGIKLYGESKDKSRIRIRTQIDKNYSSQIHTIEIRAYSREGILLNSQTKFIDVKMLPEITATYVLPSGEAGTIIKSQEIANKTAYLANGVDANFRIETQNSNSELEINLSGDLASKYSFVQDVNNHYVLKRNESAISEADIGKKVKITFTTFAYLDNGDFEKAECSIEFTIISFVIHGVSVNNSIDNSDTTEIYGYFDKEIKLNFYFDKDDISFYDATTENEPYWDTVYDYREGIEETTENITLKQIYSILKTLNTDTLNTFLILNNNLVNNKGEYITAGLDFSEVKLSNNRLTVEKGYNDDGEKYLAVAFRLFYTDNTWKVEELKGSTDASEHYTVNKNYKLNFKQATEWYEPTVIHNEQDFLEMSSGGQYILAKDLKLENYIPLDVNLIEFDGNGKTITINSFGLFNDEEIQAGLFRQIYEDMIVKNVTVNYEGLTVDGNPTFGTVNTNGITYTDLCNNPNVNYTSINFGGIAAINNGIITNCEVGGRVVVNASTVEQKKFASGGNYEINFFIGGMVAENSSTGYITNSTSTLNIFSQANIGGFVYSNSGKIVSCAVEQETTIYAYNNSLEKTIVVEVAGFVVENLGGISMSYVNLNETENITSSIKKGTMSAKDISAGFAYLNNGSIADAYVQISKTGINNNTFAGFVYSNLGSVSRAYTFINSGLKVNNNDSMFAPAGSVGFENCIEFIAAKSNYTNGISSGVSFEDVSLRNNKEYYEKYSFAFGDNESAVWQIDPGSTPKLVSTLEQTKEVGTGDYNGLMPLTKVEDEVEDDVDEITYKPNFAYYGTKENPYIIHNLETWNRYFTNNTNAYYRIVKDIDFLPAGDNPATSTTTFRGNIQGNNMVLSNIMLYSTSSLDALGLFRNMESANDNEIKNAVRNLTLTTTSVWASKTSSVGLLAGVIENFNIYNITIDAEGVIMVGGNAVGGLAGVVRGEFDLDQISSNIGANSTRASTQYNYSIYISTNNRKDASSNLKDVYYAGSVVGILDGYNLRNFNLNKRDISSKCYMVRNVSVSGELTILGDTVGGAFGFVGERVYAKNIKVNISGSLAGVQYSAGIVGENRGVVDNNNNITILEDNIFTDSTNVSSGLVGFNLGGLVRNATVQANISKTGYGKIVGGIVGRNIYGTINNVMFDGELKAYFTGGIIGANYSHSMLLDATTGAGTISSNCKTNSAYLIPSTYKQDGITKHVEYQENGVTLNELENVSLSTKTLNYFIETSKEYYSYKATKEVDKTLDLITSKNKVLGLVVGLSYEEDIIETADDGRYKISLTDEAITFNVKEENITSNVKFNETLAGDDDTGVILRDEVDDSLDIKFTFENVNVVTISEGKYYVIYLIGSKVTSFDSWFNTYSEDYVLIKMAQQNNQ